MAAKPKSPLASVVGAPQLALIAPFINEKSLALAADLLDMTDEKVAMLIAKAVNPHIAFTNEQEGMLRGLDRKTVGKRKRAGELDAL